MTGRALIRWSPFHLWPWELIYCMRVGMNTEIECTYVYVSDEPPREFTHYARVDYPPGEPAPTRHQFRPS
mgnify:CR=1 FL=1